MSVFGRLLPRITYYFCVNYKIMSNYVDIIVDKEDNCSGIRINFSRGNHCKVYTANYKSPGKGRSAFQLSRGWGPHKRGIKAAADFARHVALTQPLDDFIKLDNMPPSFLLPLGRLPALCSWRSSSSAGGVLRGIYRDYPQIGK